MTIVHCKIFLTFAPGVNVLSTAVVPITDDAVLEDNETFSVVMSTTDPNVLLDPASAIVTIVDNDGKMVYLYKHSMKKLI